MAMKQQEVIKYFMASLDNTTLSGTAAVDEAVKACSKFNSTKEVIDQILKDRAKTTADNFLKNYCGINLDNADTGAITGSDAGGSKTKTANTIIPDGKFDSTFKENTFTKRGVTFTLVSTYNGSSIEFKTLTEKQKQIWRAFYSFWAEGALKLIEDSYGYSFNDADAKATNIHLYFVDGQNYGSGLTADKVQNGNNNEKYIYMYINMDLFKNISLPDGKINSSKYPYWIDYYLDRLFAHELTHAIMTAKVDNFYKLPKIIIEGTAELTGGVDDSERPFIENAVSNKDMLAKYLDDKVDGLTNEDYVGGYIFLRYLAKQAATDTSGGVNISNSNSNTSISGTAYNDTVSNSGNKVSIYGGAGNDSVYNASGASYVTMDGGAGNDTLYNYQGNFAYIIGGQGEDSIYNKSWYSTINGGAGNDTITNYDVGYKTSINGGEGNDIISLSGSNYGGITITGGKGNDSIYAESLSSSNYGILYLYDSGDGNDTVTGISANDTIKITGGKYSTEKSGSDLKINVDSGSILLKGGANVAVKIDGTIKPNPLNVSNSKSNTIISGTAYNDTVSNSGNKVSIFGGAGNDSVYNSSGANYVTMDGGAGNDTLYNFQGNFAYIIGGQGDDSIYNKSWYSTINGGAGNDIIANYDVGYKTSINGGEGNDIISLSGSNYGGITINGGKGNDTIFGGAGNDTVSLGGGNDIYIYSSGNDFIQDYTTSDKIKLSSGSITSASLSSSNVILKTSNGNITVKNGKDKKITIIDSSGKETTNIYPVATETLPAGISVKNSIVTASSSFKGNKIDLSDYQATKVNAAALSQAVSIVGTAAANSLKGGKGADKIFAGAGNDTLWGGAGNDSLLGENGNDLLKGEAGNDTLSGGSGNDTLTGGAGSDTFIYSAGNDVITDYAAGDKIKISSGKISKTTYIGKNVIFTVGSGSLTVQNGKGKKITIIDSAGKSSTKTYNSGVSARTLDLLYDNNFMTDDTNLDSITESKFSVTQIQTQDYSNLAQDEKTFIAYAEK